MNRYDYWKTRAPEPCKYCGGTGILKPDADPDNYEDCWFCDDIEEYEPEDFDERRLELEAKVEQYVYEREK